MELAKSITPNASSFLGINNEDLEVISLKKGERLINEGDPLKGFFILKSGSCKIQQGTAAGVDQILWLARAGETFLLSSCISKKRARVSVEAIIDSTVYLVSNEIMEKASKDNKDFNLEVMKILFKRLKNANNTIADMAQKTAKERLAGLLLYLQNKFKTDDEGFIDIILTRKELSNLTGSAVEGCIRFLSSWKKAGLIELDGKRIKIINIQKLSSINNGHC